MNSQTHLTTAKLSRMLLVIALVVCPFLTATSNAQTATATLTSNGSNTINVTQNGSFQLTLSMTTNFESGGYTVFYMVSPNGSGLFRAVARQNTSPFNAGSGTNVFNDPTTTDGIAFTAANGLLDPTNNNDLGYTGDQVNNQPATSNFSLQMITFNVLNAPTGTYTIFTDRGIMVDRTGGGFNDRGFSAMMTINVIPEPSTVGLAVIGGAALLVIGYRKHRAARA